MQGFYSKLESPSSSPTHSSSLVADPVSKEGVALAEEAEKARALLRTFSSASLAASAGLAVFCVVADVAVASLTHSVAGHQHLWARAALDNAAHGVIGFWAWAIVVGLRRRSDLQEALLAGGVASMLDLDHFYAAGSLSLQAALSLPRRPPLHCSTLLAASCLALRLIMAALRLKDAWRALPWLVFVAGATHHARDGARRGLWLWPLGHTPPLPYWLYVGATATLPPLCALLMHLTGAQHAARAARHGVAIDV